MSSKSKRYRFETIEINSWNRNQLLEALEKCSKQKVLVVGDIGLDRYTIGTVERISPEAPVPIVLVEEERLKLGLAANVADNIHVLGATPILLGIVGKDRGAEDFRKLLKKGGMSANYLVSDGSRRTVLKERVVSDRQQLVRIDYESSHQVDSKIEAQLIQKFERALPSVGAVIIEDYAKGTITLKGARAMIEIAQKSKKIIAIDPNLKTPIEYYQGATLLTPNTKEAEHLAGIKIKDSDSLLLVGAKILRETRAQYVVITRGKEGMAIFSKGTSVVRLIPTYAREVYDVSGAGDTVISVLVLALSSGLKIEEACILGNLAAGVEVGKRGTATVTQDEIRLALEFFLNP